MIHVNGGHHAGDPDPLDVIDWHPSSIGRRRYVSRPRFTRAQVVLAGVLGVALGVALGFLAARAVFAASPAAYVSRSFRSVTLGSDLDRGQREVPSRHRGASQPGGRSDAARDGRASDGPPGVRPVASMPGTIVDPALDTPAPRPTVAQPTAPLTVVPKATPAPPVPAVPSVAAARALALRQLGAAQYRCVDRLWQRESGWNPLAHNPSSGAHGIPQALPGSKMGPGWQSDPIVQVRWGLGYIASRYGTACAALAHSYAFNWY